MTMPEYRARISIPGLPFEQEDDHDRLYAMLLRDHAEFGPVMTWEHDATVVVIATNAPDEAAAASDLASVVAHALHAADLGDHYPARVEIERVDEREPVTA